MGGKEQHRLGGSALAQCYKQIGDDCPDLEDSELFVRAFNAIQKALKGKLEMLLFRHLPEFRYFAFLLAEIKSSGNDIER